MVIFASPLPAGKCTLSLSRASFRLCIRFLSRSFALTRRIRLMCVFSPPLLLPLVAPFLVELGPLLLPCELALETDEHLDRRVLLLDDLACSFDCCLSSTSSSPAWFMLSADTGEAIEIELMGDWAAKKAAAELGDCGDGVHPEVVTLATLVVQQSLKGLSEGLSCCCCCCGWLRGWWSLFVRLWNCGCVW